MASLIRIWEWSRTIRHDLTNWEREEIDRAAKHWQERNHLPQSPLYFTGANGCTLCTRQYIGVIEAAGRTIEIYPKLDAHLLKYEEIEDVAPLESVMRTILWMLDVAGIVEAPEADTTQLEELPTDFIDLFALLLAKNLREELGQGLARHYEQHTDNLIAVRRRIDIATQISRNINRMDRIACIWDEFTVDMAMNRLLRCACRYLLMRSRHARTVSLLQDCLLLLEDVPDVSIATALQEVRHLRYWNRGTERFRRVFELVYRLLRGFGHALERAEADTFVFLIDMNTLFEKYVEVALSTHFQTLVKTQYDLGTLLSLPKGGIKQHADFYLRDNTGRVWIGDAKYKHLAQGQSGAATFTRMLSEPETSDNTSVANSSQKEKSLSPDDVRQLTVYAELEARKSDKIHTVTRATLMLLYPFVGTGIFKTDKATAWNGSTIYLVPVRVYPTQHLTHQVA